MQPASRTRAAGGASAVCGGAASLAFFLICVPVANAAEHVRLRHALDKPMTLQLERLAAEYNAAQQEFEVELVRVRRAPPKTVRLALPLNTARPMLYYNRDAFR